MTIANKSRCFLVVTALEDDFLEFLDVSGELGMAFQHMIINSKDSFFSFVDAAEFPEITLLQLCRQRRGGSHNSHCVPHAPHAPLRLPSMISCCCKSSGYGACVVVFNDYVRYIERLNFFACLPYSEKKSSSIVASNAAQLFCGWQIPPDWM